MAKFWTVLLLTAWLAAGCAAQRARAGDEYRAIFGEGTRPERLYYTIKQHVRNTVGAFAPRREPLDAGHR